MTTQLLWMSEVAGYDKLDKNRRRALVACVMCVDEYFEFIGRRSAEIKLKREAPANYRLLVKAGEGFIIAIWMMIVIISAAVSWAIKRLLDWLFPDRSQSVNIDNLKRLLAYRKEWGV
jgi:hypothetical protein